MFSRKSKVAKSSDRRRRDDSLSSEGDNRRVAVRTPHRDSTKGDRLIHGDDDMSIDEEEGDPRAFRRDDRRVARGDRGDERRGTFSKDDKTETARDDFKRDFREPTRPDPKDDSRRGNRDDPRDDFRSSREDTRDKTRPAFDRRDTGGKNVVTAYVPCAEIEEQVIAEDIETYLGPGATVKRGWHPDDERVEVYHMKGNYTLTRHMIEDLKMDSIRWKEEQRRRNRLITYASSETHKRRQEGGESRPLARPIPASRLTDPANRLDSEMSSSPRDRTERETRDLRDTREPRNPREPRDIREPRDTRDNRDPRDVRDTRENFDKRDIPPSYDDSQFMTRKEVEQLITMSLKEQGKSNVSRIQFERLTAEFMERNNPKPPRPKPGPGQPNKPIGRKTKQLDEDKDPNMFFR